jgi:hypothetical protein
MVSKLLLAAQEVFFSALDQDADPAIRQQLGHLYYRIRAGIGFNKSPAEYGAFPTDPYSHTPKHAGARQPGMTGQVKEEILCRFGELGVRVENGAARFQPALLRSREFIRVPQTLRYLDIDGHWQEIELPPRALGFTWCQVPIVYQLDDTSPPGLTIVFDDGTTRHRPDASLPAGDSAELFRRSGRIRRLELHFPTTSLFAAPTG